MKKRRTANTTLKDFRKFRRRRGLKSSKKRAAIIEYFLTADRHFTVEQLYDRIKKIYPSIGYSTVYRTLKLLVECGCANIHHFGEEYARFEPIHKEQHHDHLVCIECGRIIEFTHEGIEEYQQQVASKHDFKVKRHELQIFGLCDKCQKKHSGK